MKISGTFVWSFIARWCWLVLAGAGIPSRCQDCTVSDPRPPRPRTWLGLGRPSADKQQRSPGRSSLHNHWSVFNVQHSSKTIIFSNESVLTHWSILIPLLRSAGMVRWASSSAVGWQAQAQAAVGCAADPSPAQLSSDTPQTTQRNITACCCCCCGAVVHCCYSTPQQGFQTSSRHQLLFCHILCSDSFNVQFMTFHYFR